MFRTVMVVVTLLGCAFAQTEPPCTPTTPIASQERTHLKHRNSSTAAAETVTVSRMLLWGFPPGLDTGADRLSEQPIDAREGNVYQLTGKIWRIGREANDCDYHLEIAATTGTKTSTRIIAEIPQEQKAARKALLNLLPASARTTLLNAKDGKDVKVDLQQGIAVTVTGLAFYDGYHYSPNWKTNSPGTCNFTAATRHKRGNKHGTCAVGTIWELHPVWQIEAP